MTRLKTEWISYMTTGMARYNSELREKIGLDLCGLSERALCYPAGHLKEAAREAGIAAVPITQGEGIIGSFSDSIAAICRSMGFASMVTEKTDISGLLEAYRAGANIAFVADDGRYLAMNLQSGGLAENDHCTALGYITALEALVEKNGRKLKDEKLLVVGLGRVGTEALKILKDKGLKCAVYDRDYRKTEGVKLPKICEAREIKAFSAVLDFTNEGGWLEPEMLSENALYATPGVPYSPVPSLAEAMEKRSVHDELEIGTAVMLASALGKQY